MRNSLLILLVLTSSCATIVTKKKYKVRITSSMEHTTARIYDSTYYLPAIVRLIRSKKDLSVKLCIDSIEKNVVVKPTLNPWFVFGNAIGMQIAPAGYLIDFTNPKRFTYGKNLHFDMKDTSSVIRLGLVKSWYHFKIKRFDSPKGMVRIVLSLPEINSFYLHPLGENLTNNAGFVGISAGGEYFYKANRFAAVRGGVFMDFAMPIPTPVDYGGAYETMSAFFVDVTDNIQWNRLSVGYGLHYTQTEWSRRYGKFYIPDSTSKPEITLTENIVGLTVNAYFQWNKFFYTGIIYRPCLLTITPQTTVKYQHTINFDLALKIPVRKRHETNSHL